MLTQDALTRRELILGLAGAAVSLAAPAAPEVDHAAVERNDLAVERCLVNQVTSQTSPFRGSVPDDFLLHSAHSAGSVIEACAAALLCSQSRYLGEAATLMERVRLAAGFLERSQSAEGNIDLLSTNFNSPPDTGFVVHNVATAAALGKMYGNQELVGALRPFLVKAGAGMAAGGIHTPNHRWVIASALAQVNEVFPDASYVRRIDQWLAEGIDIDDDGQYIERSTVTYNTVTDRALTVMAAKLKRPALLDAVRRNLSAMLYLIHPDGEVVTEVSRRQDQFARGTMAGYWFPASYLAAHDRDGVMAGLLRVMPADSPRLSTLLEYPELAGAMPDAKPLPDDYEKQFPLLSLARIRRGRRDATMVMAESSRFFSGRNGGVGDQRGALRDVVLRQRAVCGADLGESGGKLRIPAVVGGAVLPAAVARAEGGLEELGRAPRAPEEDAGLPPGAGGYGNGTRLGIPRADREQGHAWRAAGRRDQLAGGRKVGGLPSGTGCPGLLDPRERFRDVYRGWEPSADRAGNGAAPVYATARGGGKAAGNQRVRDRVHSVRSLAGTAVRVVSRR